ncbi:TRAP transporter substrate-binding protein [Bacillus alveayuensis]|uniref:TRAP transporter substrate-binding protein n=1 Tax=Aeribacillus alveayuensis TaxID=279215 RepID=UPI000698F0E2|nr:TRAP transporter substrate-binding protein [Bacillus alveayuensis]
MKVKAQFFLAIILIAAFLVLTACNLDSSEQTGGEENGEVVVMKFTHGTGIDGIWQKTAEKFSELVGEYSDGKVKVEIYPGGQIGSGQKSMEDIQNGLIEATVESVNNISPFAPSLGMFDLPYLFQNENEFYQVVDQMGGEINKRMIEESGLRAITWLNKGIRALGTVDQEVKNIDDLKGLKIRVPQNPILLAAFESWGVNATPIAWDETITALQQGVIDGLELPYDDYESTKLYENINYITDIGYKYDTAMIVIGDEWFQQQPEDIQEAILKAGAETTEWARVNVKKFLDESKKNLEDHVTFSGVPEDEEIWMEKAVQTWPNHYERINGKELLSQAMEILGRELPEAN